MNSLANLIVAGLIVCSLIGCTSSQPKLPVAHASFGEATLASQPSLQSTRSPDNRQMSMLLERAEVNLSGSDLHEAKTFDILLPLTYTSPGRLEITLHIRGSAATSGSGGVELWTLHPRPALIKRWSGGMEEEIFHAMALTMAGPASGLFAPDQVLTGTARVAMLLVAQRQLESDTAMLVVDSIDASME